MSRKMTGSAHHFTKVCSFKEILQVVQSVDSFTTYFWIQTIKLSITALNYIFISNPFKLREFCLCIMNNQSIFQFLYDMLPDLKKMINAL